MTDDRRDDTRAVMADAQAPDFVLAKQGNDPLPGQPRGEVAPGEWEPDGRGLPPDCPVHPLGVNGEIYYFIDTTGAFRAVPAHRFSRNITASLFAGRINYLFWAWPRRDKNKAITSWRPERVHEDLISACALKPPWDAVERVRGRGAWRAQDGTLILHCGNRIYVDGKIDQVGELGGYIYPTRPPIPYPWAKAVKTKDNPVRTLLPLFRTWQWVRPDADPIFLLGWIVCGLLGGALRWRPSAFMIGDTATGKSTLQEIVKALMGDGLIQSADTSSAGIYQRINQDSLPVAIDELEGEADTGRQKAIIKLARLAASGALMLRGGAEHKGVEFNARSAFLFSSINSPPMDPQDLNRMALLRLNKLPPDAAPPALDHDELAIMGRKILRLAIDNWHKFDAARAAYGQELAAAGHDGRGQDTFATLLACADLVIGDAAEDLAVPMGEDLRAWREILAPGHMVEYEDALENWWNCLSHLLSVQVDAWRGGTKSVVGQVIEDLHKDTTQWEAGKALLAQAGLGLPKPKGVADYWLAIPNQNPLLRKLFVGSKWAGDEGAGVWMMALRQGPRDEIWKPGNARINGVMCRCTLISVAKLSNLDPFVSPSNPNLSLNKEISEGTA